MTAVTTISGPTVSQTVLPAIDWLVDWWDQRCFLEKERAYLAHAERMASPELMAMYNKPQSVVNLQQLHDDVLWYVGAFGHELIGPTQETA
jgi:hypothetical protein